MKGGRQSDPVEQYIKRLERELHDVPRAQATEMVAAIREHIREALAGDFTRSNDQVRGILQRLGDPAELAHEERERLGLPFPANRPPGWLEVAAIVLTFLVWPVGVIFLWASSAWSFRTKAIATLVPPGGIWVSLFVTGVLFAYPTGRCVGPVTTTIKDVHGRTLFHTQPGSCTGGAPIWLSLLLMAGTVALVLMPFLTAAYLSFGLRRNTVASIQTDPVRKTWVAG